LSRCRLRGRLSWRQRYRPISTDRLRSRAVRHAACHRTLAERYSRFACALQCYLAERVRNGKCPSQVQRKSFRALKGAGRGRDRHGWSRETVRFRGSEAARLEGGFWPRLCQNSFRSPRRFANRLIQSDKSREIASTWLKLTPENGARAFSHTLGRTET
jgi:hypothetical protein